MNGYGRYLVLGTREYRGHVPGAIFEAQLDPDAERRAIARGNIRLLERCEVQVPAEHELPPDWPLSAADEAATEAPRGASLITREGR